MVESAMSTLSSSKQQAPSAEHVAEFEGFLAAAASPQLHKWSIASLQNAWAWAKYLQGACECSRNVAPRELLCAVITSPFLLTHPQRLEMLHALCDFYSDVDDPPHALASDMVQRLTTQETTEKLYSLADILTQVTPAVEVILAGRTVRLQSFLSWQSQRRSLQVAGLAQVYQQQIIGHPNPAKCFAMATNFFALEQSTPSIEKDIVAFAAELLDKTLQGIAFTQSTKVASLNCRLLHLSPWLAARLCQRQNELAPLYVSTIISALPKASGELPDDAAYLAMRAEVTTPAERLASLVYDKPELHAACDACLAAMEKTMVEKLLP
ncbi:hypothetical protein ACHHYP_03365 [Achlya hypogyna]|uniref:Uncharacterized protein n=1 Tax=Achlya hypogyna TaxID=1202772 RepID=A0A1V9Z3S4_ACHHY|nr:hypothetical protein ACHHYP_03365 [Achlya hypogyna]